VTGEFQGHDLTETNVLGAILGHDHQEAAR
jgi:hypothetical protein